MGLGPVFPNAGSRAGRASVLFNSAPAGDTTSVKSPSHNFVLFVRIGGVEERILS